jgi:hypothetical protein
MAECVVDAPIEHPYSWCVKPAIGEGDTIIDDTVTADPMGYKKTTELVGGTFILTSALVSPPGKAMRDECKDSNDSNGKIGNKYVLKTGTECMHNGNLVSRYKYINNMASPTSGFIPAAMGSALKINGLGILDALMGESTPKCSKVKLKCHVVKKTGADTAQPFFGDSTEVYIPDDELKDIKFNDADDIVGGAAGLEDFENLYESIAQYLKDNKENFATMNILNSKVNSDVGAAFNNQALVKMYYLSLSLLMAYIMFKFINKN